MKFKTAIEIRTAIENGDITAVEVTQHYLDRIKAEDGKIKAFLETFDEEALEAAKGIDEMKAAGEPLPRLAGIPVAIKDIIMVKGHVASVAANILREHRATFDATAVKRLREAGAVILGRVNCDDAAMGVSTETSCYHPTYNPWDTSRTPGGSSGGSTAAVAAGFAPVALGTDTGGSVRQPSGFCSVTGMKPSYGRVSRNGVLALCSSFDQIGPVAHTAEDCALVMEVIEGRDEFDATTVDLPSTSPPELIQKDFKGMSFGLPKEYFMDGMDAGVEARVREAIELIKEKGGEVKEISLPLTQFGVPTYYILLPAEASSNLARYDGLRYGTRAQSDKLMESYLAARGAGFGEEVKRRIMIGTFILSAGYHDAFYKKALAVRNAMSDEFKRAFEDVDVIVCPTSPGVPWKSGELADDPIANYLADVLTCPANVVGICGISVPCGFSEGLPVGLQFLGPAFKEENIYRAAMAYQSMTDWHLKEPGDKV